MLVLPIEENAYTNNLIACLSLHYVMSIGQRETSKRLGAIPAFNAMCFGNVRHFEFSLEIRCSKCFRSHKAYCVTLAQKRGSMNNSLVFIPCNARIVSKSNFATKDAT